MILFIYLDDFYVDDERKGDTEKFQIKIWTSQKAVVFYFSYGSFFKKFSTVQDIQKFGALWHNLYNYLQ